MYISNLFLKSKWRIILCSALLLLLITSVALAYNLPVPQQQQQGNYTCWASCGSMITAHFNGNTTNNELNIVLLRKGPVDINNPAAMGTVIDTAAGVAYYAGVSGTCANYALSYNGIKWQINNDGPVAAANSSHMRVFKGYNTGDMVVYNDPWDGLGHAATYNYLVNTWGYSNSAYWK